jgi:formate dehydrogenase gamma subunit
MFSSGSHGRTLLRGNLDVPTCTTCHGDHDMTSLKTQAGQVRNFAGTEVCIWCHGNLRMMARYALDTSPVESYMRDFHGLTQRGTAGTSATCADCHDAHRSLPSSHPESRMNITNRGSACGKCHGKSSSSFIMSFTHRSTSVEQGGFWKTLVTTLYLVLIALVIGGMLVHNLIVWSHAFRRKLRFQKRHGRVVRLNLYERTWHWILLVSFSLLILTGFALKYPESVFFRWMYALGMTEAIRAWIHRVAAIALVVNIVLFLGYQIFYRAGRKWLLPMMPRWRDFREFAATMRFHLGRSQERPRYGIFNYAEKAEYWALLWGIAIMVVTGLVLWFPKAVPPTWPAWIIEVARIIHFFEAVLAGLAILVWHFFHTIFKLEEYPMDTSWLSGVLTEEEARHRFTDEAIAAQIPPPPPAEPDPAPLPTPEWRQDPTAVPTPETPPAAEQGQAPVPPPAAPSSGEDRQKKQ